MDKNSNKFTILFAVAVCVVLATALASTFNGLKPAMDKNKLFDKNRNVLIATGLYHPDQDQKSQKQLEELFRQKVKIQILEFHKEAVEQEVMEEGHKKKVAVVQVTGAKLLPDKTIADLPALKRKLRYDKELARTTDYGALYVAETDQGKVYCIPIAGPGLWSTLYGFLALDQDLNTVRGITFYQHGETPGLGGEVDKEWWQKDWPGKKILQDGRLVSITVLRGRGNTDRGPHEVDGISGATITCNGVTRFLKEDLETWQPYFKKLRSGGE